MNELARLRAGQLAGSQRFELACGLTEFPREIYELADTLEVLDLSGNALDTLPDDLDRLRHLRVLFCSGNRFTVLPEVLGRCPALDIVGFKANQIRQVPAASLPRSIRWLILTDNRIEALPASIGQCSRLQKLMLAGNRLSALPADLAACESLELLRISANLFDTLPVWLTSLPRLSWLAFGGNPLVGEHEAATLNESSTPRIRWVDLELGHRLGEGASGVIHQARWRLVDGRSLPVAVKLFKGSVTSDGWPRSEMAACIAAGAHPQVIPVLGQVEGHPDGAGGLVMELVGAEFGNLAGPPSFQSCTRDVYAADAAWSVRIGLRIAKGVASAMAQLHSCGVVHGDLYAHNILWRKNGDCLLGDFGAAWSMSHCDEVQMLAFKGLDVRAFGCLLEELRLRSRPTDSVDDGVRESMKTLEARCLNSRSALRPAFAEIASTLDRLDC